MPYKLSDLEKVAKSSRWKPLTFDVHDYRRGTWGHALHGWTVEKYEPGKVEKHFPHKYAPYMCYVHLQGHGCGISEGDCFLITMQKNGDMFWRVIEINYHNPSDMFSAWIVPIDPDEDKEVVEKLKQTKPRHSYGAFLR